MSYSKKEALDRLFKPGKVKILEKIDKSEPLTNTERMYYYRSIRPVILATQNVELQHYLRTVDETKKLKVSQVG